MASIGQQAGISAIILVIALPTGTAQQATILAPPNDVTGKLGGIAEFTCRAEFKHFPQLAWEFNQDILYSLHVKHEDYPQGKDKYTVAQDGRHFTLTVANLLYSDGGKYTCRVLSQAEEAHLIVIGDASVATAPPNPTEGSTVEFTCTAKFAGPKEDVSPDHHPVLEMSLDGEIINGTVDEEHDSSTNCYNLTQVHMMTLGASMNGMMLRCAIRTSYPEEQMNVTHEVTVLYPVRNIRYTPKHESYPVGAVINCTAEGNPEPNFQWVDSHTGSIIHRKFLKITTQMVGRNLWKCTANNTVVGTSYGESVDAAFDVLQDRAHSGYVSWRTVVIPGVVSAVVLACMMAVLIRTCNRKPNQLQPQEEMKPLKNGSPERATPGSEQQNRFEADRGRVPQRQNNTPTRTQSMPVLLTKKNGSGTRPAPKFQEHLRLPSQQEDTGPKTDRYDDLVKKICDLKSKNQLRMKEENEIMKLIGEPEQTFPPDKASPLILFLRKYKNLIGSEHYLTIMKEMVNIYKTKQDLLKEDPLLSLVEQLENIQKTKTQNHAKLLKLIEILIPLNSSTETRSRCMMVLISSTKEWKECREEDVNNAEFKSPSKADSLPWDDRFVSILKKLLEDGADPTWSPPGLPKSRNLLVFSKVVHRILGTESTLRQDMLDLLEMMTMSVLQSKLTEDRLKLLNDAARLLISDTNADIMAENLKTILLKVLKIISPELSRGVNERLLELLTLLRSAEIHSTDEKTADFSKEFFSFISSADAWQGHPDVFLQVVRSFQSICNTDVQNDNNETPLHLFICKTTEWKAHPDVFIEVVRFLKSPTNIEAEDMLGRTALHLFASKAREWKQHPDAILKIIEHLKSPSNINVKDKMGETALNVFRFSASDWKDQPKTYLLVFRSLKSSH